MELFTCGNFCSSVNNPAEPPGPSVDKDLTLRYSAEVLSYQRVVVVDAGTGSSLAAHVPRTIEPGSGTHRLLKR
jgi:hypothetical protein